MTRFDAAFHTRWRERMRALPLRDRCGLALLSVAAMMLATVIYMEIGADSDQVSTPVGNAQAATPAPSDGVSFTMPSFESYDEVTRRPLFSPNRRAAVRTAAGQAAKSTSFVLAGVILSGDRRIALIQEANSPKLRHVDEGQEIDGWIVRSIDADKVLIDNGAVQEEIKLHRQAPSR